MCIPDQSKVDAFGELAREGLHRIVCEKYGQNQMKAEILQTIRLWHTGLEPFNKKNVIRKIEAIG